MIRPNSKGFNLCDSPTYGLYMNENVSYLHFECLIYLVHESSDKVTHFILGKETKTQLGAEFLLSLSFPVVRIPDLICISDFFNLFKNMESKSQSRMCLKTEVIQFSSPRPDVNKTLVIILYIFVILCLYCISYYISMCFCNFIFLSNVIFTKSDVKPVASSFYPLPEVTVTSDSTSAVAVV